MAVVFHKNGEFRDTLEIHWKDGSETCLAMSGELRPSAYGEHGGWVVLIPPADFDAKKQPKATSDQQQRLPLLPGAWVTIDPSKLLLTVPMQNLAEIATEVDLYPGICIGLFSTVSMLESGRSVVTVMPGRT